MIVSGPVVKVSNVEMLGSVVYSARVVEKRENGKTKKFKIAEGTPMQLTIVSCTIEKQNVSEDVFVILPFPMMRETRRFKIFNIDHYNEIFKDVDKFFNKVLIQNTGINWKTWDDEDDKAFQNESATTHVAGSYRGLLRLREKCNFSDETLESIKTYYKKNYGFVVIRAHVTAHYFPIAYVHELLPGPDNKLFLPTRHIYCLMKNVEQRQRFEEAEDELEFDMQKTILQDDKFLGHKFKKLAITASGSVVNTWDHTIYIVNKNVSSNPMFMNLGIKTFTGKQNMIANYASYIKLSNLPVEITFNTIKELTKITISKSYSSNHDIII